MRRDMKHLLFDAGKSSGTSRHERSMRARIKADVEFECFPIGKTHYRKEQSDYLNPLKKFLLANCGRQWDDVYSDICRFADSRCIRGYHLRQHVWFEVSYYYEEHSGWSKFVVDKNGVLTERDFPFSYRKKRIGNHWQRRRLQDPILGRNVIKIKGILYFVDFEKTPARTWKSFYGNYPSYFDLIDCKWYLYPNSTGKRNKR